MKTGHFSATGLPGAPLRLSHEPGKIGVADREIDVDGIGLVDRGENRAFTRADQISRINEPSVYAAVKRRSHLRIVRG